MPAISSPSAACPAPPAPPGGRRWNRSPPPPPRRSGSAKRTAPCGPGGGRAAAARGGAPPEKGAPGRRADVVVGDGDPLENGSAPVLVLIDGVQQPLDNHQTKLRDRYRSLAPTDLPQAYRK